MMERGETQQDIREETKARLAVGCTVEMKHLPDAVLMYSQL